VSENLSQGRNPANNGNSDLRELKQRVSPRLLRIPGVSGVGIHGGRLIVYLVEESEALQQEVAGVLESERADIPVNYVVTGVFRAR
jgi:hypothetical protein